MTRVSGIPARNGVHACYHFIDVQIDAWADLPRLGHAIEVLRRYKPDCQAATEFYFQIAFSDKRGEAVTATLFGCVFKPNNRVVPVGKVRVSELPLDWRRSLAPTEKWEAALRTMNFFAYIYVLSAETVKVVVPVQTGPTRTWYDHDQLEMARPFLLNDAAA